MSGNPFITADRKILADAGTSGEAAANLLHLCDRIGPRFAGTEGYRRAAEFMLGRFKAYRLDDAALEPFPFTAWRRGPPAELVLRKPLTRAYPCYELPYSAATGPAGLEAPLLDAGAAGVEELGARGAELRGRLVLSSGARGHRMDLYAKCAEHGAAGFLLGHTAPGGVLITGSVAEGRAGAIPAVSIAHESVQQIRRLAGKRPPRFRLVTHGTTERDTTWNVVGELPGTERPGELVILGGHLDSHDIGPCAFDNAAGAVVVMETARLLAKQRRRLKRTVRFIGFGAEEVGLLGSHVHARRHAKELRRARFMLNCDMPGLGGPGGLAFHECPAGADYLAELSVQMETPLACVNRSHSHSDHFPFILKGLPTAGLAGGRPGAAAGAGPHTAADTPDKLCLTDLRQTAAFAARFLLRAASDERWPLKRRSPKEIRAFVENSGGGKPPGR